MRPRPRVTFVLPGRGISGGVRVTVAMANGLLDAGHDVRIACWHRPGRRLKQPIIRFRERLLGLLGHQFDWISQFRGPVGTFRRALGELSFHTGEVVIAVGSHTVRYVQELDRDVVKVRYCHGFTGSEPELMAYAWGIPMPTLAVAPGLIPELERLSGTPVTAVVPNGIDNRDYFPEDRFVRDGIGTVYCEHPNKSPAHTIRVLDILRERYPEVPPYVFGADARPPRISRQNYHRLPSVRMARELYNRSKVWFLASEYEGFGLPILEAMACGCTVVSTAHHGCDGLIEHGRNGFVVAHGDDCRLADHVAMLLDDDELRARLVAAGFETVRKFTWKRAVSAMDSVLRAMVENEVRSWPA